MVLHGPNGSGKSSLLRVLAGLIPAFDGDVSFEDDETVEECVTYIGHANPIKAPLSVKENLTYWAALYGAEDKVSLAMQAMDLEAIADLQGRVLSSGQRRRLTLARLFLEEKPIWLLDEPTVGLDVESCKLLETKIASHRASGGIVMLSTHVGIDVPEVKSLDMAEFSETQAMRSKFEMAKFAMEGESDE